MFARLLEFLILRGERASQARDQADLEARLRQLEKEAATPSVDLRGVVLSGAGDLCLTSGDIPRALTYFGRALDGYMTAGHYDSALAVCRKMIDSSPTVVRARCTLTFLQLGKDLPRLENSEVSARIRESFLSYAAAARNAGNTELAIHCLKKMAAATDTGSVRHLIGDILFDLGAVDDGAELHCSLFEEHLAGTERKRDLAGQQQRWAKLLSDAVTG
ncbi:MAG: hypothetical protein LBG44_10320 [Gemmatimonadota bacterium]|jgi:tetratricopeptide (TPR) repeat protein|nr:hypothetical protein [Gemmatimonadota bacterium]